MVQRLLTNIQPTNPQLPLLQSMTLLQGTAKSSCTVVKDGSDACSVGIRSGKLGLSKTSFPIG